AVVVGDAEDLELARRTTTTARRGGPPRADLFRAVQKLAERPPLIGRIGAEETCSGVRVLTHECICVPVKPGLQFAFDHRSRETPYGLARLVSARAPPGDAPGLIPRAARSRALCKVGDRRAVRRIRLLTVDELVARELLPDRGPERTGAATVGDAGALGARPPRRPRGRTHAPGALLCPQPPPPEPVPAIPRGARPTTHA